MLLTELYPYQEDIPGRLMDKGSVLGALDTGLGKTVATIAAAERMLAHDEATILIVCPSGLRLQWARALAQHTDVETQIRRIGGRDMAIPTERWCVILGGTPEKRATQVKDVYNRRPNYVIAGYETAVEAIRKLRYFADFVIIDEGTVLSSFKAKRAEKLRSIAGEYKALLTATPIEHAPENIYGPMAWLAPGLLGTPEEFERAFIRRTRWGQVTRYTNLPTLHNLLKPYLVRKRIEDADVAPYMPETQFHTWTVGMSWRQRQIYGQVAQDLAAALVEVKGGADFDIAAYYAGMDESTKAGRAMAIYTTLQMLLNHPQLVKKSAEEYLSQRDSKRKTTTGSAYAVRLMESGVLDTIGDTPKFLHVVERVRRILDEDPAHKVVIVSRYKGMQPLFIRAFAPYKVLDYHGQQPEAIRMATVDCFNQDEDARILVMSHAGAYGVDLPGGSHLINYDPPLSAGQRVQINGRIRRASSRHRRVAIIDVVTEGSLEVRQYERLTVKRAVASAVIDGYGADERGGVDARVVSLSRHADEAAAWVGVQEP
jgi:Superfamily II DNA/RNA helicases, SNF2 family